MRSKILSLLIALLTFCFGFAGAFVWQAIRVPSEIDLVPTLSRFELVERYNPRVIIIPNDDKVILSAAFMHKRVSLEELSAELRALPEAAWPYGRAVYIEEPGVLMGDDKGMYDTRAKVGEVLSSLNMTKYMPSL